MNSPVVASMLPQPVLEAQPTPGPEWAQVSIPKPTYTAEAIMAVVAAHGHADGDANGYSQSTGYPQFSRISPQPYPQIRPQLRLRWCRSQSATAEPAQPTAEPQLPTAEPEWTGELSMEYVADTPTPEAPPYVPPTASRPFRAALPTAKHWIDVNLTQQMVYAYAGDTVVNSFVVSTGTWLTPTVTGKYKIWIKLRSSDMSGPDYYLPDVPYVMYFYKDYGIHGTYWHNNFGTPMSHGCVNLSIPDAEWLYNFCLRRHGCERALLDCSRHSPSSACSHRLKNPIRPALDRNRRGIACISDTIQRTHMEPFLSRDVIFSRFRRPACSARCWPKPAWDAPLAKPLTQGRMTLSGIGLYNEPAFKATKLHAYGRDEVVSITGEVTGEAGNPFNTKWYELNGEGYTYSGWVQPVESNYQKPEFRDPGGGRAWRRSPCRTASRACSRACGPRTATASTSGRRTGSAGISVNRAREEHLVRDLR